MKKLLYDVFERPTPLLWGVLSIQHVFAMAGATILVPLLTGLPVSVALFASGLGTLIYIFFTKAKVPVYLGSSFAYIAAVNIAKDAMGGDISAAQTGLILVGLIYILALAIGSINYLLLGLWCCGSCGTSGGETQIRLNTSYYNLRYD